MKKKIISALLCLALACAPITVLAEEDKDSRIAELESEVVELQATIEDLQEQLAAALAGQESTDQDEYRIGDTWTVEGLWSLTIDSVEETSDRNEYSDYDAAAVYIITYTYENLGYESDGWDGLYLSLDLGGIVDAEGFMGYSYPGDCTYYAQETPVGAKCKAQVCIGVDNAGDFKIYFSQYDGDCEEEYSAVFVLELDQGEAQTE